MLVIGCGGGTNVVDAGASDPDATLHDAGKEAAILSQPDARIGLASGSACDASGQCLSGACTLGACSDWAHVTQIGIDTTSTGADIKQAVASFPLLVRLDAANFNFAEARDDGADIRFVDSGSKSLSHEIERWDAENSVADIWVLLPRIEGGSSGNFVLMYWGNPLAAPTSSGPSVFGTFANVLHMTGEHDGATSHLGDASGQNNTGLVQNPPPSTVRADGIAGPGLAFDGKGTYLATTTRLTSPQTFSVSLWLKTTSTARGGIAGFASKATGSDVLFDRAIWMDESGHLTFGVLHGVNLVTVSSLTSYSDGAWHLVVARFGSAGQYLFVDGEPVADDPANSGANSYAGNWRFGEEPLASPPPSTNDAAVPAGNFISGTLDEIRITYDEPSDAWIKLAYATQRPGANAVSYLRTP